MDPLASLLDTVCNDRKPMRHRMRAAQQALRALSADADEVVWRPFRHLFDEVLQHKPPYAEVLRSDAANIALWWDNRRRPVVATVPEITEPNGAGPYQGSASLSKLRAVMADPGSPIFRRLDAADVIVDFEIAAGAGANVPADQLSSSAYQFYRQVEGNAQVPESLQFRALKAIAKIENSRRSAAQTPEAHFANREFHRRLVNAERSRALREAGVWERVVSSGAKWSLTARDSFDPPVLPHPNIGASIEADGSAEYLDACNRWRASKPEEAARYDTERKAVLLSIEATNRRDDWRRLLAGDHAD